MRTSVFNYGLILVLSAVPVCFAQNDANETRLKDAWERSKAASPEKPEFSKGFRDLADYYCASSRFADAEKVYGKLLEEREHAFGLNSPEIVPDINDLARVN